MKKETDRKSILKNLKRYRIRGKKLLRIIPKKPKLDQGYSEIHENVQKWYEELNVYLSGISDPACNLIVVNFPVTGITFEQLRYIKAVKNVLEIIEIREREVNNIPHSEKKNDDVIGKILGYAATVITIIGGILLYIGYLKNQDINNLKIKINTLQNCNSKLTEILRLIEGNPEINRIIELKKGNLVKLFGEKVLLNLDELPSKKEKVRIQLGGGVFSESRSNVEFIELYKSKSFTLSGKTYWIYIIEINPDSALIFIGGQIF